MRLFNFYDLTGKPHLGAAENDRVFDLSSAIPDDPAFQSVVDFVGEGNRAIHDATNAMRKSAKASLWHPFQSVKHAPLIPRRCRIFAVGLNYEDHALENNLPVPESPIIFDKLSSNITPHNQSIPMPFGSTQVDYEAEFAFMIGTSVSHASDISAAQSIAGYTIMNDVTARDFQMGDKQWFRGKNCEGFSPLGPYLVTADAIPDPCNLQIDFRLNGNTMQHSNTRKLFFGPAKLVAFISQTITLEVGDVITTGTPAGIGYCRTPQVFLQPGDVLEVEVESIGVLRNTMSEPKS
jgi:2-keto-4-pentenoate hydratase/2-oxohepta-3-ene-1,7-dioic acid hydratase in catechol pathway